jgi:hypothetical protein
MQNWYNGLTKGQRIIIAVTMFITLWMIGLVCIHKTIGVIMGIVGLLPSIFFELGRRK